MLKHPKPRSISSERENDRRSDSESTQMMTPSLISAFAQKRTFSYERDPPHSGPAIRQVKPLRIV